MYATVLSLLFGSFCSPAKMIHLEKLKTPARVAKLLSQPPHFVCLNGLLRLVRSRERRARLTLEDIGQRKRRAAIARATATYPGNDGVATSWGPRGQRRPSRSSTMSWVLRVFAPATASDQAERAAEAGFKDEDCR